MIFEFTLLSIKSVLSLSTLHYYWSWGQRKEWECKSKFFGVTIDFVQDFSFFILSLNRQMLAGISCIHFHIYRRSHQEVFFKYVVLCIFTPFTEEHSCKSVPSALFKLHFCMDIFLYIYYIVCSRTPFFQRIHLGSCFFISFEIKSYLKTISIF